MSDVQSPFARGGREASRFRRPIGKTGRSTTETRRWTIKKGGRLDCHGRSSIRSRRNHQADSLRKAYRQPRSYPTALVFPQNFPVILPEIPDGRENQASAGSATWAVSLSSTPPGDGCRGTVPTIGKNAWNYGSAPGTAASSIPTRRLAGETHPGRPNARRVDAASRNRARSISPRPAPSLAGASDAVRRRHRPLCLSRGTCE